MKTVRWFCIFLLLDLGCKQVYNPPALNANKNYLVVSGFINASADTTTITLTRTRNLSTPDMPVPEIGARPVLLGSNGSSAFFTETGNGNYIAFNLNLDPSQTYSLKITTSNGSVYASDFVPVRITPAIDSVYWQRSDLGINIYANTHDPSNNTRYYKWDYTETWEYRSTFVSYLFVNPADSTIYSNGYSYPFVCWRFNNSKNILIASSAKLSTDIISLAPLNTVPLNSEQISQNYSILVNQYALTKDAYDYWQNLQKSTEQTGTIFDQQPSQITGNIHCVSNPNELVIGYFSVNTVTQQRIFITRNQVLPWGYDPGCEETLHPDIKDTIGRLYHGGMLPIIGGQSGYYFASNFCVDCTIRGGTSVRPSYMPQ